MHWVSENSHSYGSTRAAPAPGNTSGAFALGVFVQVSTGGSPGTRTLNLRIKSPFSSSWRPLSLVRKGSHKSWWRGLLATRKLPSLFIVSCRSRVVLVSLQRGGGDPAFIQLSCAADVPCRQATRAQGCGGLDKLGQVAHSYGQRSGRALAKSIWTVRGGGNHSGAQGFRFHEVAIHLRDQRARSQATEEGPCLFQHG